MARYSVYFVSTLLCFLSCGRILALGQTTEKPTIILLPSSTADVPKIWPWPTTSTTPKSTTTSSTSEPTTTSTTEKPTTTSTTEKPTTTSTTEKPTTTSTTPKPTTTSTPAPTPAPAPKPLPPAEQGTWAFTDNNVTCIVVQFAARLNVTYMENGTKLAHALLNVPSNATVVGGSCQPEAQWIQLSWPNTTWANNVTMNFARNATTHQYALSYFNVILTPTEEYFPNSLSNASLHFSHSSEEWRTALSTSYRCNAQTQLNLTDSDASGAVATVTMSRLQEQAFRSEKGTGFSTPRDCGSGDLPDAVPIAVGCALGGLVLVVLIAYLVGRRRSAARGYVSM